MSSPTSGAAIVGGLPTVSVDIPVCAVFLALYTIGSILNLTIFVTNIRRKKKFFISWILNAFCLIRVVTTSLRIAWARSPTNSQLAIAAQIFNSAGILICYIVNLVFSQRILRAKRPKIGWNSYLGLCFNMLYMLIAATLIMGISTLVVSINKSDPYTIHAIRSATLASTTFICFVTVLPLVILAIAYLSPSTGIEERFGQGSMANKLLVLSISSLLAVIIAGFKTGTTWEAPRPRTNPAWYHSNTAFYIFNFALEIIIIATFLISRVDKRFYVPDKCKGPGDYTEKSSATPKQENLEQDMEEKV